MKGHRLVVPQSLQKVYTEIVHRGRPGAESIKRRARDIVFWPTMSRDIDRVESHALFATVRSPISRGNFATQWDFKHVTSSPEFPQCNGLAERAVQSAKQLMEKSERDGTDVFLNLLNMRNIPRNAQLGSPAQRLMSRQTRTTLPVSRQLLQPAPFNAQQVTAKLQKKNHRIPWTLYHCQSRYP